MNHPNDYDILVLQIVADGLVTGIYACLRKEYAEVTRGVQRCFAINAQPIAASLGHLEGCPEYWVDTTVFWAGPRYYSDLNPGMIQALRERIATLGITLSPSLIQDVLPLALGMEESQIATMASDGRLRRLPLNPVAVNP